MDTWEGYGIVPQVLSKRSCRRRFRCCSFLFRCSSDGDRHQENELQKPCFSASHGTDSHLKITGRPRICRSSWTRRAGESKFDVGFGEIETVQHCSWFVGSCTRRGPPTSILAARRLSGIHLWSTSTLQGQLFLLFLADGQMSKATDFSTLMGRPAWTSKCSPRAPPGLEKSFQ